ncbi:hypothetical protein O181_067710 [Austropuccinia psidii MF-1]|uniref:CCHC-type domain-containing protein n=1 Tax=Austropuccinia psidii MF-1 TaxID=1389203 RepID=A0A9Q3I6D4_9BASI|nr:hypothetical protein [Austropuccinia psidii MF-1]
MVHIKIPKNCGGSLEHALRRRCIEPCSTEEYINSLEDIVTRAKIGRKWKQLDIKIPNKLFIKKGKPKEPFQPKNNNEQTKCHKCGCVDHLANDCLKKENRNEILETEANNNKEEESNSEKDTEESESSESDEINIINDQVHDIDSIYKVIDVNSNWPQIETSDTFLTNLQDAKLHIIKPTKGMGYTVGKESIGTVMLKNQEAKINPDTGAYYKYVGKNYSQTLMQDWEDKLTPIPGVELNSASQIMKPLRIID